jgi:hypothetical protein
VTGWNGAGASPTDRGFRRDLIPVVNAALAQQSGVEGGIWSAASGPLAYAFPTYPGGRLKADLPSAETADIRSANEAAAATDQPVFRRSARGSQTSSSPPVPWRDPMQG